MSTVFRSIAFPEQVVSGLGAYVIPVGFDAKVHVRNYRGRSYSINGVPAWHEYEILNKLYTNNLAQDYHNNTGCSGGVDWVKSGGPGGSGTAGIKTYFPQVSNLLVTTVTLGALTLEHNGNLYGPGPLLNLPNSASDVEWFNDTIFRVGGFNTFRYTINLRKCHGPEAPQTLHLPQGTVIDAGAWTIELYANGKTE